MRSFSSIFLIIFILIANTIAVQASFSELSNADINVEIENEIEDDFVEEIRLQNFTKFNITFESREIPHNHFFQQNFLSEFFPEIDTPPNELVA